MAKDKLTEYDATANNNTVVGDVNLAENSALPSDMNNAVREIMSHQKEAFGAGTPLYVDQTNNRVGINKTPTVALDVNGALTQDGGAVFNEASADVDFRVESNGDANMLFVDGGTDRVGMGTATPASTVHVRSANPNFKIETTGTVASGGTVYNTLRDSTGSDVFLNGFAGLANCYQFATIFANGFMRFLTGNQAEAIRIHSNQVLSASAGVALGVGTANTASNVLDDYEEGTFTATLQGTTTTPATALTATGSSYTKIGNIVYLTVAFGNLNTAGYAGGIRVSGLPFSASPGNQLSGNVAVHAMATIPSGSANIAPFFQGTIVDFYISKTNAPWESITHNAGTGSYLYFTGVYKT